MTRAGQVALPPSQREWGPRFGYIVLSVEHIGSTAVPDLAAWPIIDLDVVVSPTDVREAIRRLANLGYVHEGDLGIAGREAFRWPPGERRHPLCRGGGKC